MEALAVALAGYTSLSEAANGSIRPVDRLHALGMGQRYREAQREAALICFGCLHMLIMYYDVAQS